MKKYMIISLLCVQAVNMMGMDQVPKVQKTSSGAIPMTRSAELRRIEKEEECLRTIDMENKQKEQSQKAGKPFAYSPSVYLVFMQEQSCSPSPSDYWTGRFDHLNEVNEVADSSNKLSCTRR